LPTYLNPNGNSSVGELGLLIRKWIHLTADSPPSAVLDLTPLASDLRRPVGRQHDVGEAMEELLTAYCGEESKVMASMMSQCSECGTKSEVESDRVVLHVTAPTQNTTLQELVDADLEKGEVSVCGF